MAKSFLEHFEGDIDNVLIVDGLNLGFRWKHNGSTGFEDEYVKTVKSFARSYNCGKIIITTDYGSSKFRKDIYPEYKGNRSKLREQQSEEEAEKFKQFLADLSSAYIKCTEAGFLVLTYKNVEADDIAAYICKRRDSLGIGKIWLISSDRDWDLLVDEEISRFSYVTRKETTLEGWDKEFPIKGYLTYKCLTGDSGDNIPGVPGVGDKRAIKLMQEYGDIFSIYEQLPIPSKYKYIQALNDSAEQLLLNCELMDLQTYCEEALIGNKEDIDNKLEEFINA